MPASYLPGEVLLQLLMEALQRHQEMTGFNSQEACKVLKAQAVALGVPGAERLRITRRSALPARVLEDLSSIRRLVRMARDRAADVWRDHGLPEAHLALEGLELADAALRPMDQSAPVPTVVKHPTLGQFRPNPPRWYEHVPQDQPPSGHSAAAARPPHGAAEAPSLLPVPSGDDQRCPSTDPSEADRPS